MAVRNPFAFPISKGKIAVFSTTRPGTDCIFLVNNFMFMRRELMFNARELMFMHRELMFNAREHNFSHRKKTFFCSLTILVDYL